VSDVRRWSALPHAAEMVVRNFNGHLSIENVEVVKASDYDALRDERDALLAKLREAEHQLPRLISWLNTYIAGHEINAKATSMRDFWQAWLATIGPLPKEPT